MLKPRIKVVEPAINDKRQSGRGTIQIIPMHYWIICLAFGVLILALLLWGFFGSIYTRVEGYGILLPGNKHIYPASSQSGGIMLNSLVKVGDVVSKKQVLAHIDQSSLASKIEEQQSYLTLLKKEKKRLYDEYQREQDTLKNYYSKVIASLQLEMAHADTFKVFLHKIVEARKTMAAEHLVTATSYENTQQKFFSILTKIDSLNNQILQVQYKKEQEITGWLQTLNQITLQIAESRNSLEQMQINYEKYRFIKSPVNGKVISVDVPLGSYVQAGQQIFSIVDDEGRDNLLALFNPFDGKKISRGMHAYVSPTFINKYQYGSINATVKSIGKYPLSKNAALSQIANSDLINQLSANSDTLLLSEIQLSRSDSNKLSWTSKGHIPYEVTEGSICLVSVEVRQQAPISLILPLFRKWLDRQK